MDWQDVVPVVVAVLGAAVWIFTIIRKQDAQIAELRAEQRSLKENFNAQTRFNDSSITVLLREVKQQLDAIERKPSSDGHVRP